MIKNDIGLLISGDTIKRVFLYSMIARQSLKSSMRNAPAKRKFPQPRPENSLGAGQKTEPCISPIKLGHGTRTNVPHHARSMRRRPHSSRYCAAARKIPHADGSPDSSRDRHRPQAPITPKRTARKIPRLPVHFGGPRPNRLRNPTVCAAR